MRKKQIPVRSAFLLAVSISLAACAGTSQTSSPDATTASATTTAAEPKAVTITEAPETMSPSTGSVTSTSGEETNGDNGKNAQMVNPMKKVTSSQDFTSIGLTLALPENTNWCKDAAYYIIDGSVAHISFHDTIVDSNVVVRAGKEELGDISGVYYKFDDTKELLWSATTPSGETIEIRVQPIIDGSDIPGVLATWNREGINYTLWEDEGKRDITSVAKLAAEVAVRSIP